MSEQPINFKNGKEPRNQLELPTLHFIVTDQWTDVLSEKAIFAWLRMYSWCKRDEDTEINQWEQAKVPHSFVKLKKRLGVGNDTFYNKILKPLWNVGLIDIEEYNVSENKGTKPMNIIVYKYPQNNKALAYEPIREIRNYETDYHSKARTFSKKGGRPKKQRGSEIEHPPVPKKNTPLFSNRTPGGSQIEHINIFNSINNIFNNLNKIINQSSSNKEKISLSKNAAPIGNDFKNKLTKKQMELIKQFARENNLKEDDDDYIELVNRLIEYPPNSMKYIIKVFKSIQGEKVTPYVRKTQEPIPSWFMERKKTSNISAEDSKTSTEELSKRLQAYLSETN